MKREQVLVKNQNIEAISMGNDLAMMNVDTGKYVVLNSVAKDVWELMDGQRNLEVIIDQLLELYEVTREVCETEVNTFVKQLLEEDLVSEVAR